MDTRRDDDVEKVAYYTLDQAAEILQLSESTLRRGMKKGEIPRAKFCGKVLIPAWFINKGFDERLDEPAKPESSTY